MTREFLQETNFQNDVNLDADKEVDSTKVNKNKEKYTQWKEPEGDQSY